MGNAGTYLIRYDATDSSNNAADTQTRTVVVQDTTPPTVAIVGDDLVMMEASVIATDADANAYDTCPPYEFHPCVSCSNQDQDCLGNCISFSSDLIEWNSVNDFNINSEYWV